MDAIRPDTGADYAREARNLMPMDRPTPGPSTSLLAPDHDVARARLQSRVAGLAACLILMALAGPTIHPVVAAETGLSTQLRSWQVGEPAPLTVTNHASFIVYDEERTAKQRDQVRRSQPLIFQEDPMARDWALRTLNRAVTTTHKAFLDQMEEVYQERRLTVSQINAQTFRRQYNQFRRRVQPFPLSLDMAKVWALNGDQPPDIPGYWTSPIQSIMSGPIRVTDLPSDFKPQPSRYKVFGTLTNRTGRIRPAARLGLNAILRQGQDIFKTNVSSLAQARKGISFWFTKEDRNRDRFLASFITNNLLLEIEWSRKLRDSRTESVWIGDAYDEGAVIVTKGETLTSQKQKALQQLADLLEKRELEATLTREHARNQSDLQKFKDQAESTQQDLEAALMESRWQLIGAGALLVGLIVAFLGWQRRGQGTQLPAVTAPAPGSVPGDLPEGKEPAATIACPSCDETISVPAIRSPELLYWQKRAVQAEDKAREILAMMRKQHAPSLLRWAKSKIIRGMVSQRNELVEQQNKAEAEIESLIDRLSSLDASKAQGDASRIKAYENRIQELEEELAMKTEETRALIKATFEATQSRAEARE